MYNFVNSQFTINNFKGYNTVIEMTARYLNAAKTSWLQMECCTPGTANLLIAVLNFKANLAPLPGVFFDSTKSTIASITFKALGLIVTFKIQNGLIEYI